MQSVFKVKHFHFPYENLKFPGQHSEEKILFITREGSLIVRSKILTLISVYIFGLVFAPVTFARAELFSFHFSAIILPFIIFWTASCLFVYWWIRKVWQKTLFIITTRRLTKFIHTTPWTRYQMSLTLEKIVDTGSYRKGFLQMITGYGYFVARSAAGAVKNFKIINISFAEDLHNYVNKLLFIYNEKQKQLDKFRPFIPGMKGKKRDEFVRKTTPKYAKPKRGK